MCWRDPRDRECSSTVANRQTESNSSSERIKSQSHAAWRSRAQAHSGRMRSHTHRDASAHGNMQLCSSNVRRVRFCMRVLVRLGWSAATGAQHPCAPGLHRLSSERHTLAHSACVAMWLCWCAAGGD